MPEQPREATPEELSAEEGLSRFESEAAFHQRNVLPLDSAMNEGRFYGLLLRGDRPLTTVQRVGFLLVAIIFCGPAFLMVFPQFYNQITKGGGPGATAAVMTYAVVEVLVLLVGIRIGWLALRPSRKRKRSSQK